MQAANCTPTFDALKKRIESAPAFSKISETKELEGYCAERCDDFSDFFSKEGIEFVRCGSAYHVFLAVRTSDCGVVVFDPTFKQFYPNYHRLYFLDSPKNLVDIITRAGKAEGLNAEIFREDRDYTAHTAKNCFVDTEIVRAPFAPLHSHAKACEYLDKWVNELQPLNTKICPMRLVIIKRLDDLRSVAEASQRI